MVISDSDAAIGFCALKFHYGLNCDLYVFGTRKESHRQGAGRKMVRFVEEFARDRGANDMKSYRRG